LFLHGFKEFDYTQGCGFFSIPGSIFMGRKILLDPGLISDILDISKNERVSIIDGVLLFAYIR